jgi:hypothetical protein
MLLIVSQGTMGPTLASCPMPAKTGAQKILRNDFENEHVIDTFFFTYCYIKSKGKQTVNSKY